MSRWWRRVYDFQLLTYQFTHLPNLFYLTVRSNDNVCVTLPLVAVTSTVELGVAGALACAWFVAVPPPPQAVMPPITQIARTIKTAPLDFLAAPPTTPARSAAKTSGQLFRCPGLKLACNAVETVTATATLGEALLKLAVLGLMEQVAPDGSPEQARETAPLKPLLEARARLYVAACPAGTEAPGLAPGATWNEKNGTGSNEISQMPRP